MLQAVPLIPPAEPPAAAPPPIPPPIEPAVPPAAEPPAAEPPPVMLPMHEFVVLLQVCPIVAQLLQTMPWFPHAMSVVLASGTHSPITVQQPSQLLGPHRPVGGPPH
jgi:hypothetical protein